MKRSLLIIVFFLLIANIGLAQSISYDRQTLQARKATMIAIDSQLVALRAQRDPIRREIHELMTKDAKISELMKRQSLINEKIKELVKKKEILIKEKK